jgi:hypothetical protein
MPRPLPASSWCDQHRGQVDEGRTREVRPGYRVCDACYEVGLPTVGGVTVTPGGARVSGLLAVLADTRLPIDDRAGAYAVLHQVQLRINRGLRAVRDDLVRHLVATDSRQLGPLSIKATAVGVAWPCNDPGNWADIGVQDALAALTGDPHTAGYVRQIPAHLEIDTAALGRGIAESDPHAIRLHRELRTRGWRTEEARTLTLAVRPVTEARL